MARIRVILLAVFLFGGTILSVARAEDSGGGIAKSVQTMIKTYNSWLSMKGFLPKEGKSLELEYMGDPKRAGIVAQRYQVEGKIFEIGKPRILSSALIVQKAPYNIIPHSYWPSNAAILTVHCISEYFRADSEFRPYFDLWDFQLDVPTLWDEAETDLISPNPFRQERNLIVAEFEYLNRYLFQVHRGYFPRDHFNVNMYLLFRCLVLSRAIGDARLDLLRPLIIIPQVIDFINHDPEPNVRKQEWAELEHTPFSIELKLKKSVYPGDEITISYGDLSNFELLSRYGFMLEDNKAEHIPFGMTLEAPPNSAKHDMLEMLLSNFALVKPIPEKDDPNVGKAYRFFMKLLPTNINDIFPPLRIWFMELSEVTGDNIRRLLKDGVISLENELKVYNLLYTYLNGIKMSATTTEEDQERLNDENNPLTDHQAALIRARLQQKYFVSKLLFYLRRLWSDVYLGKISPPNQVHRLSILPHRFSLESPGNETESNPPELSTLADVDVTTAPEELSLQLHSLMNGAAVTSANHVDLAALVESGARIMNQVVTNGEEELIATIHEADFG